jgi:hypothetical protein
MGSRREAKRGERDDRISFRSRKQKRTNKGASKSSKQEARLY